LKKLIATWLTILLSAFAIADDKKPGDSREPAKKTIPATKIIVAKDAPAKAKVEITLRPGDAAPALKADKWFQGNEVKAFEAGKVYVVEFWAVWCGPCIVMMPHLSELHHEFKSKGVTIIGFSSKDTINSVEKVTDFVEKRGPKLGYTFAYEDNRDTNAKFMKAAGQSGIPCSFVIDKAGKIAYIGHPMFLDAVLPKVVDGTWDCSKGEAESTRLKEQYTKAAKALMSKDAEEGLAEYTKLAASQPLAGKGSVPHFTPPLGNGEGQRNLMTSKTWHQGCWQRVSPIPTLVFSVTLPVLSARPTTTRKFRVWRSEAAEHFYKIDGPESIGAGHDFGPNARSSRQQGRSEEVC
jgi:thiol-disulfide isomerase/thioredoxin